MEKLLLNTNNMKKETGMTNGDLAIAEYGDSRVKKLEERGILIEKEIDLLRKKLNQIRSFEIEGDEDDVGVQLSEKLGELKGLRDEMRALMNKFDLKK